MIRASLTLTLWLTAEQFRQLDALRDAAGLTREEECRRIIEDVLADDAAEHTRSSGAVDTYPPHQG